MSRKLHDEFVDGAVMPAEAELLSERIGELMRLADRMGPGFLTNEKPLEHYRRHPIYRLNLAAPHAPRSDPLTGRRIYLHASRDVVTILDVVDHDVWLESTPASQIDAELAELLNAPVPVPEELRPLELRRGGLQLDQLKPFEVHPEWLYRLDADQIRLAKAVRDRLIGPGTTFDLIVGGPGTGKTAVLTWLLNWLVNNGHSSLRFDMSDAVAEFVANVGTWERKAFDFEAHRGPVVSGDKVDVLLVDDPARFLDLEGYADEIEEGAVRHVVVAVDFQQLDDSWPDSALEDFEDRTGAVRWRLRTCYRQRRGIGARVKDILDRIAASSPGAKYDQIEVHYQDHRVQWRDCNDLEFTNEGGSFWPVERGDRDSVWAEVAATFHSAAAKGDLWDWAPAILILKGAMPYPSGGLELFDGLPYVAHHLDEYPKFKGLEFQHEVLILSGNEWSLLQRIQTGRKDAAYRQQRLSRIALTRARDTMTVIAG